MSNEKDNKATIVTVVIGLLILSQIFRTCDSKSDSHDGWDRSDAEMNRVR